MILNAAGKGWESIYIGEFITAQHLTNLFVPSNDPRWSPIEKLDPFSGTLMSKLC